MSQYHSTLCGCIYDVDASYNWMDQQVEVDAVVISHICNKHLPGNNSRLMDENAILREQNRQLREALEHTGRQLEEIDGLCDASLNDFEDNNWKYIESIGQIAEDEIKQIEAALAATAPAGEE